jgi:hypothetical protein
MGQGRTDEAEGSNKKLQEKKATLRKKHQNNVNHKVTSHEQLGRILYQLALGFL